MTDVVGLQGWSPLGFMASLGLLRLVHRRAPTVRLAFREDGTALILGADRIDLVAIVVEDASQAAWPASWVLEYEKEEKRGKKMVADLKAPPVKFREFLAQALKLFGQGDFEAVEYAAAYGTDVVVDGRKNTKPTAFHFTAANQQFLGTVEAIRKTVTRDWTEQSLRGDSGRRREGPNLRWDPDAERNWALMAENPNIGGTKVDAPLEWLAFRGLPLFPTMPHGKRLATTGVRGRGENMRFAWPLWTPPASLESVRSLCRLDWHSPPRDRRMRGVFAVCASEIRRTDQGFGNFGPSLVST